MTWGKVKCADCMGYGQVSDYRGDDFHGAVDCSECGGTGSLWVSPKGRIAHYPGGPFLGMATEAEVAEAFDA